jgi:secreted PhoX family phosphatase
VPEPEVDGSRGPAFTRRRLLIGSGAVGIGVVVAAVTGRSEGGEPSTPTTARTDVAPRSLVPDPDGVLDLPDGFEYRILSREGDQLRGGGGTVPGRFDGMGAFEAPDGGVGLVRNHELGGPRHEPMRGPADLTFDPASPGGTTTLILDGSGAVVAEHISLAGTSTNCAGGVTPWGTWLSCEENEGRVGRNGATVDHGWVFEVHPFDMDANRDPTPLRAMGRFAHEAVVVDPTTGVCYLTEDNEHPAGLLYRFEPTTPLGGLHSLRDGGVLSALHVDGVDDLSVFDEVGTELEVAWKEVPDPLARRQSTRRQFSWVDLSDRSSPKIVEQPGGAITRSHKLEGAWWGEGRAVFTASFARTSGEDWSEGAHDGQVWSYDPRRSVFRLEAHFPVNRDPEGATAEMVDGPDNITANPFGGVLVCEDGEGAQHLVAVHEDGSHTLFARNALNTSEMAGVVFSPDATTLYVNILGPGHTLAITGPFERLRPGR